MRQKNVCCLFDSQAKNYMTKKVDNLIKWHTREKLYCVIMKARYNLLLLIYQIISMTVNVFFYISWYVAACETESLPMLWQYTTFVTSQWKLIYSKVTVVGNSFFFTILHSYTKLRFRGSTSSLVVEDFVSTCHLHYQY